MSYVSQGRLEGGKEENASLQQNVNGLNTQLRTLLAGGLKLTSLAAELKAITFHQPGPVVRTVGATGEPAFTNGWTGSCTFQMLPNGVVWLRGAVADGTPNTDIFTLPAGYRPATTTIYNAVGDPGGAPEFGALEITSGGLVTHMAGSEAAFYFNLFFQATQPVAHPRHFRGQDTYGTFWPIKMRHDLGARVAGCIPVQLIQEGGQVWESELTSCSPDWEDAGDNQHIFIHHVPGLQPGRRYTLEFLLFAR